MPLCICPIGMCVLLQNVFSYYRMCSLTIECVLLLQFSPRTSSRFVRIHDCSVIAASLKRPSPPDCARRRGELHTRGRESKGARNDARLAGLWAQGAGSRLQSRARAPRRDVGPSIWDHTTAPSPAAIATAAAGVRVCERVWVVFFVVSTAAGGGSVLAAR